MDKLKRVLNAIDKVNQEDPNTEMEQGTAHPKELIYGQRMTEMLHQHFTNPSELLQIAVRGQHIKRWAIPRTDFPMDRKGYLRWRTQLKQLHADLVAEIMQNEGYSETDVQIVRNLLLKKDLKKDPDAQTLEDVICLVFLEYYIHDFMVDKEEDKLIGILQKTWKKMSDQGRSLAMKLSLPDQVSELLQQALAN